MQCDPCSSFFISELPTIIMSFTVKNTPSTVIGLSAHFRMVVGPPFILPKRSAADMVSELDEDNPAEKSKRSGRDDTAAPEDVVLPPLVLSEPTTAHHGQGDHSGHPLSGLDRGCGPHNRECVAQALSEALIPWVRAVHQTLLTQPKDGDTDG